MKAMVNGWLEVGPREGSTVRVLHLVDNQRKKVCRCRYGAGSSPAHYKPHCHSIDDRELVRGEDGHLYIDGIAVALCEKSEKALREELAKWQQWEKE